MISERKSSFPAQKMYSLLSHKNIIKKLKTQKMTPELHICAKVCPQIPHGLLTL